MTESSGSSRIGSPTTLVFQLSLFVFYHTNFILINFILLYVMSKRKTPSNKGGQEVVSLLTTTGSPEKNTSGNSTNKVEGHKANATRPQIAPSADDTVDTEDTPEPMSMTDKNQGKGD